MYLKIIKGCPESLFIQKQKAFSVVFYNLIYFHLTDTYQQYFSEVTMIHLSYLQHSKYSFVNIKKKKSEDRGIMQVIK